MQQKRIHIETKAGETLSILVERQNDAPYTFPYVAVLNDWDEGCKYSNGKTPAQAVEELLDLIDAEASQDLRWLNVWFPEVLPSVFHRQAE